MIENTIAMIMMVAGFTTVTGLLGWVIYKVEKLTDEMEVEK